MKKILVFLCLFGLGVGSPVVGMKKKLPDQRDVANIPNEIFTVIFKYLPTADVIFTEGSA